ncbi:MAG: HAMP domain-containing sensor histidine kinase [Oscillospiraceae bacterium]|nr:HAMP domain-containing sensor histidine kinase [Oscillospiraceae bacterium]
MMKFLKSVKTRVTAFILAFIIIGACTFGFVDSIVDNKELFRNYVPSSLESYEYSDSMMNLFDKLWLIGNTYLKNTDSKGKYTCSKELESSIKSALSEKGLLDENGKPELDYINDFRYYVSYGNSVFSNTDSTYEELIKNYSQHCLSYRGDYTNIPQYIYHGVHYNSWYSTSYGMYYYNFNSTEKNVALFDFDTTGLDYYTDNYGVKIYYKKDGSTPLPIDYENYEYGYNNYYESEETVEGTTIVPYQTPKDGEIMVYDGQANEWHKVDYSNFSEYEGSNENLKIAIVPSDNMIAEYENSLMMRQQKEDNITKSIAILIPLLFVALILSVYVLTADGWSVEENKFIFRHFDRIWSEVLLAGIAGFIVIGGFFAAPHTISIMSYNLNNSYYLVQIMYALIIPVIYSMIMILLGSIIRKFKCGKFCETTVSVKILKKFFGWLKKGFSIVKKEWKQRVSAKYIIRNNAFAFKFLKRLGICIIAEMIIIIIGMDFRTEEIIIICSLIILGLYVFLNFNDLQSMTRLSERIENMTKGDYSPSGVPEKDVTYKMNLMLDNISDGIQTAVENQIKSERMKIDLVTNVSHDLKTPLTSIISYIDLLSAEELTPEASDYVKILEQKSARLKSIVSDLFDLAKATSNTDIALENIDMCILIEQVKADMSDKIEKYGREIRTDIQTETAPIYAEGKKLYRVYQNLIDNALKYSMNGTRIYIKLYTVQNEVITEIKNISAYEMKFTPEEITERFTRGDESRTSEGNGLGLSIAKSFTEACGGNFNIKIDGDVFIAETRYPLRKNG